MKELLDKLSSYNILNYLLPGVIFVLLAPKVTHYDFIQDDVVIGLFLYYFVGLVISRFGSLIIEPVLKRCSFLHLAEYEDFVNASKKDDTVDVYLEASNTYRTIAALCLLLLLLKVYETVEAQFPVLRERGMIALVVLLLIIFLFAYRKQTGYINQRIKAIR